MFAHETCFCGRVGVFLTTRGRSPARKLISSICELRCSCKCVFAGSVRARLLQQKKKPKHVCFFFFFDLRPLMQTRPKQFLFKALLQASEHGATTLRIFSWRRCSTPLSTGSTTSCWNEGAAILSRCPAPSVDDHGLFWVRVQKTRCVCQRLVCTAIENVLVECLVSKSE